MPSPLGSLIRNAVRISMDPAVPHRSSESFLLRKLTQVRIHQPLPICQSPVARSARFHPGESGAAFYSLLAWVGSI